MSPSHTLSDKAKGKQRAVETAGQPGPSEYARVKTLVIRFSEGIQDLAVEVAEKDAVRDIKREVRIWVIPHFGFLFSFDVTYTRYAKRDLS